MEWIMPAWVLAVSFVAGKLWDSYISWISSSPISTIAKRSSWIAINWRRFAELFAFDDDTNELYLE
jgi:hypothetical protein